MLRSHTRSPANLFMILMMAATFWLAFVDSAEAKKRLQSLSSSSVLLLPGDTARLMISNTGRRPVRIRMAYVDAMDFSVWQFTDTTLLAPHTSTFFEAVSDKDIQVIASVVFDNERIPAGGSESSISLRTSLQVIDGVGQTQVFTDDFKVGRLK